MITLKQIKEMANQIGVKEGYKHIGIRVQDTAYDAIIGTTIKHHSNKWIDGEMLTDKLDGVCAIKVQKYQINPIDNYSGYDGNTVLILGSQRAKRGYDDGEIIMREPVVLDIRSF